MFTFYILFRPLFIHFVSTIRTPTSFTYSYLQPTVMYIFLSLILCSYIYIYIRKIIVFPRIIYNRCMTYSLTLVTNQDSGGFSGVKLSLNKYKMILTLITDPNCGYIKVCVTFS